MIVCQLLTLSQSVASDPSAETGGLPWWSYPAGVLGLLLWLRSHTRKTNARREFRQLSTHARADLLRNIFFVLYPSHGPVTAATLARHADVSTQLMHAALERLGHEGCLEVPGKEVNDDIGYGSWDPIRLTVKAWNGTTNIIRLRSPSTWVMYLV